jgi:hypothetical protein
MNIAPRLLLAGLCVLFASACGGGGSIAITDLGTQRIDKGCDLAVRCGAFPDKATCIAASTGNTAQLTADVNAGTVKYDGSAEADCLNAISNLGCSTTTLLSTPEPQSCKDAVEGTIADGGACTSNEQCISQSCHLTGSCMGTCDPTQHVVAAGADCSQGSNNVCNDASWCQPGMSSGSGTCAARTASGTSCMGDSCVHGTTCVFDFTHQPIMGTCGTLPTTGASSPIHSAAIHHSSSATRRG